MQAGWNNMWDERNIKVNLILTATSSSKGKHKFIGEKDYCNEIHEQ